MYRFSKVQSKLARTAENDKRNTVGLTILPVSIYLRVGLIDLNGTYFGVNLHSMVL